MRQALPPTPPLSRERKSWSVVLSFGLAEPLEVTTRLGEALGQGQEGLPMGPGEGGSYVGFSAASPISSGHRQDGSRSLLRPMLFLEGEDWFREQGTPVSVLQASRMQPTSHDSVPVSTLEWRGCLPNSHLLVHLLSAGPVPGPGMKKQVRCHPCLPA